MFGESERPDAPCSDELICPSLIGKVSCSKMTAERSDRVFELSCLLLPSLSPI